MEISISEYDGDGELLVALLEELQDYFVALDPLSRFVRLPEYGESYASDLVKQTNGSQGVIYIAKVKGVAVGLIAGIIEELSEKDRLECVSSKSGTILELVVKEHYRDNKIGSLLTRKIETYFRERDCDVIYVGILEANKRASSFYKSSGYQDRLVTLMKKL